MRLARAELFPVLMSRTIESASSKPPRASASRYALANDDGVSYRFVKACTLAIAQESTCFNMALCRALTLLVPDSLTSSILALNSSYKVWRRASNGAGGFWKTITARPLSRSSCRTRPSGDVKVGTALPVPTPSNSAELNSVGNDRLISRRCTLLRYRIVSSMPLVLTTAKPK